MESPAAAGVCIALRQQVPGLLEVLGYILHRSEERHGVRRDGLKVVLSEELERLLVDGIYNHQPRTWPRLGGADAPAQRIEQQVRAVTAPMELLRKRKLR